VRWTVPVAAVLPHSRSMIRYGPGMQNRAKGTVPRRRKGKTYSAPLDRLTTPMVRDNGVLREASWDEALTRAAEGFARIRDDDGPEAFGMFSCSKSTNEMNYAAQKFIRTAIGSNNIDSCNRT
jgi:formate dehydrogenase (hydrogenase)